MSGAYEEYKNLMSSRRFRDAVEVARAEAHSASGRAAAFWLTREAAAHTRAGDPQTALKCARKALDLDASDLFAVYAAAEALERLGRHAEALGHYQEALREPRLEQRSHRRILSCLEASAQWDELLSRIPGAGLPEDEALGYEAAALAGLGRAEEALARCRRRLEIRPHHPPALWRLADLEVAAEGPEPVLERWRRMARIPSLPPVYREIHASLARRAGRTEEALEVYGTLQGAGPRVQRRHAFALAKSGREAEAIPLLEELLRAEPGDMYLHSAYGGACRRASSLERAVNFYNTLISLHPEEKTLYGRVARLRRGLESA